MSSIYVRLAIVEHYYTQKPRSKHKSKIYIIETMAGDLDILSWRAAVAKGKKLYALMRMSSDEASRELDTPSQSKFHSFEDLKAYGWTESDPNGYHLSNLKIDNVLSDIIGERQLDLRKMEVKQFEHDGQFVKNYVTYPVGKLSTETCFV